MRNDITLLTLSVAILLIFIALEILSIYSGMPGCGADKEVEETVHLDLMHAEWCEYCGEAKIITEEVANEMPGHANLVIWDEALRGSDAKTTEIYSDYKGRNLFGGFPTLIARGSKGEAMLVGKRNKEEVKEWICLQFENPPKECK
ncbi:MAG: hypothetical protein ABIH83_05755 [Candidatus Micrarchaeota archaeon]